jgi:hypothetical protein
MPTGTGKTGVIACLTRLSNHGSSLVLTPWANLRAQMIDDLHERFWKERDLDPGEPKVVEMLPSSARSVLRAKHPQVIVATFATLNDLRREHKDTYESLAGTVSLVVVDECHYEPAVEWGKSVKGLKTRTVLLTATPYRNDLKLFRISNPDQSAHHFTHKLAASRGIIRELGFDNLPATEAISGLAVAFANYWKKAKRAGDLASADPRAIICCLDANDIEVAVHHLRREGLNAIGVHEQFEKPTRPHLMKEVPDPRTEIAEIWVHQRKLTEGLDDHRFCCIGLFTRIRNDRKLIQQIGRILRRKDDDRNKPALLLAPPMFSVEDEWNAYRAFETQLRLLEPRHFGKVVDALLSSQPSVEYFEGKFRRRFDPSSLEQKPQVVIPPSVLVRVTLKDFSLADYIEDCTDTLNTEDAVILGPQKDAPCQQAHDFALWVYASVRNSRFLQDTSLYEIRLETHCVVVAGGYVLIADSRGFIPEEYVDDHTSGVAQGKLARFLDHRFEPTHVSVDSSIPYETVLRGADLHGSDLRRVPPSLTDRTQICRAARGTSKDLGRRYVGMHRGRLRKEETAEERRTFELPIFVDWARGVAKTLDSNVAASTLFTRFMQTCDPPPAPIPKTLSIDLLRLNLDLTLADGSRCTLESSSANVGVSLRNTRETYTCSFLVKAKGAKPQTLSLTLAYDRTKRRFWFNKDTGPTIRVNLPGDEDTKSKGLPEFLNQNQSTVLIGLEGGEIVYQGRNFYLVDYAYAEQALLDLIWRPTTPRCRTEKGSAKDIRKARTSKATRFPKNSLFRAVADRQIALPFADEVMVCADLGTECADFVAANFTAHEIALIHAKAGKGTKISAAAFHDLAAQAMKNLVYLTRNAEVPKGVSSWSAKRKWNGTGISRIYRASLGLPAGAALWNKLRTDILGDSNPELYVVLVTTGCCDRDELAEAIADRTKRTAETAQLLHLLDCLNGYARQLGVRVVIHDVPYLAGAAD